jgi:hypothetical protein
MFPRTPTIASMWVMRDSTECSTFPPLIVCSVGENELKKKNVRSREEEERMEDALKKENHSLESNQAQSPTRDDGDQPFSG